MPPLATLDFDDEETGPESFETAVPAAPPAAAAEPEPPPPPRRVAPPPPNLPTLTTRTAPHSIEAEEYLLSSCMLPDSGDETLQRCLDAGIRPESFYDSKHAVLYDCMQSLHARKVPVDIAVIAEELKATNQLEQVGGYVGLVQITQRVPTSAQVSYFVEKVREQAVLREFIFAASSSVEECYGFSGDVDSVVTRAIERLKKITDGSSAVLADQLACRQITLNKRIPKPDPRLQLCGTTLCTPGNISTIYAQSKAGKSSATAAAIAASLCTPTDNFDTLGFAGPNYAKHAVLNFDTEQSPYDSQQLTETILRRVNLAKLPPWVLTYNLTGLSAIECRTLVVTAMREAHRRFGGIHIVYIDGIADLVADVNDSGESFPFVTWLHAKAIEYNTAIVNILHLNPGAESVKGRGHLGSQLERKSETNLMLEKDESEVTSMYSTKQRGKSIMKANAITFKWSDEHGMHRLCKRAQEPAKASTAVTGDTFDFARYRTVFPRKPSPGFPLPMLQRALNANFPISPKQIPTALDKWISEGLVEKIERMGEPTLYRQTI